MAQMVRMPMVLTIVGMLLDIISTVTAIRLDLYTMELPLPSAI